jgi:hypothetical protein
VLQAGTSEPDGALRFEAQVEVVPGQDSGIRLRGPVVHGPRTAPFLYLSCRRVASLERSWIFRLKVPLTGVDGAASLVAARVQVTGGGTVPLIGDGWTVA